MLSRAPSFSIPPSFCPVPVEEQKLGERRNEVTSSASATFLWREGGEEEEEEEGGGCRPQEENVPKLLRLQYRHPPPPH